MPLVCEHSHFSGSIQGDFAFDSSFEMMFQRNVLNVIPPLNFIYLT